MAVPGQSRCAVHHVERNKQTDVARGSASARGYGRTWQRLRATFLAAHPLCVHCERQGRTTAANEVDHIEPHGGDMELFWRRSNWQPLCKPCHSAKTAREDGGLGNARRGGGL